MAKISKTKCDSCGLSDQHLLKKMGETVEGADFLVALAGNPNTGKSTVFNALTGLRQHTGNWPGKTVARAEGAFRYDDKKFRLVDLPGTYSLLSTSEDEEIARDFILFGQPHATIVVVDATRLKRNLNLVLQILEITSNAIVCVNLMDEARRHGISIDERTLARELGVPVIPMSARYGKGIPVLLETLNEMVKGQVKTLPYHIKNIPSKLENAVEELSEKLKKQNPKMVNSRWIAFRLLEGDTSVIEAVRDGKIGSL